MCAAFESKTNSPPGTLQYIVWYRVVCELHQWCSKTNKARMAEGIQNFVLSERAHLCGLILTSTFSAFHWLVCHPLSPGKRGSSSRNPPCDLSPMNQSGAPPPRQRMLSEPWLAIHNLACLNRAYEEGMRERSLQDEGDREDLRREGGRHEDEEREDEDEKANFHQSRMEWKRGSTAQRRDNRYGGLSYNDFHEDFFPRVSQSLISLTEVCASQAAQSRLAPERPLASGGSTSDRMTQKSCVDKLPACFSRRNTLPSVTVVPPPLHLPPLVSQSESHLQVPAQLSLCRSTNVEFHPHPPSPSPSSPSFRASVRPALLPLVPLATSVSSLVAPPASPCSDKGRKSLRRHSVQLDQIRGEETTLSGLWDWWQHMQSNYSSTDFLFQSFMLLSGNTAKPLHCGFCTYGN